MTISLRDNCTSDCLNFQEFEGNHDRAIFHQRFSICCQLGRSQTDPRRSLHIKNYLLSNHQLYRVCLGMKQGLIHLHFRNHFKQVRLLISLHISLSISSFFGTKRLKLSSDFHRSFTKIYHVHYYPRRQVQRVLL